MHNQILQSSKNCLWYLSLAWFWEYPKPESLVESFQNPDWLLRKAVLVEASAAPALMAMAMAVTDHAAAGSPHVFIRRRLQTGR